MSSIRLCLLLFSLFFTISSQQDFQPFLPFPQVPSVESKFGIKYDEALEAIFSVAVKLEGLLSELGEKHSKNFMVSPLNMAVAICELILGARGKFQEQLYDLLVIDSSINRSESVRHIVDGDNNYVRYYALHEQLADLVANLQKNHNSYNSSYNLKLASVLFKQYNLTINENFKRNAQKYYNTEVVNVDFRNNPVTSERILNQWVTQNTNGLIKKLQNGPVSPNTLAILANAVYFRANWEIPFSSEINRIGKFYTSPDSYVNVTYMLGEFENYQYIDSQKCNCKMVIIPYENNELSMHIILPNENSNRTEFDINKFTADLKIKDMLELIQNAKQKKVFMILPKLSLTNTINVLGPLRRYYSYKNYVDSLKINKQFNGDQYDRLDDKINLFKNISRSGISERYSNDRLDLSGISNDPNFYLSDIFQQMTLSVNEKGTEAAAVAASAIDYIADSVSMTVDRPFLFFIRHKSTEASLFWGTIGDPTESSI